MSDSQDRKFLKRPEIKQDLLKKELNLPSKEVRSATNKEQTRIQTFGSNPINYNKYLAENASAAPAQKWRSWIRFKSDEEPEPKPEAKTELKPEESAINQIIKDLSPQVLIGIADSKLPKEKKDDLKILFEEIKLELKKISIEWALVVPVLKKTLDCDLKVASLIIHLTAACHQIWEHEQNPNAEPAKQPISSFLDKIRPKTSEPSSDVKE